MSGERQRGTDMEHKDHTPTVAKDYYSRSIWWSQNAPAVGEHKSSDRNGVNGINFAAGKDWYNNSQEIVTPEISDTFGELKDLTSTRNRVDDEILENGSEEIGEFSRYSSRMLSTEIVEIFEDGRSITENKDRRVDDLYVAVGKDDLDVVKWALDHAVSPGSRIFLVHVSPPITLIPTPVGMFQKSQLAPNQVRLYINEVHNKRKDLLQKYIQLSTEAKVAAETLLLESNDTGKAILDLISILNIANLVIGIKKLPYSRRNDKLSKGELVKKNAPKFCDVTLIHNGKVLVSDPYEDDMTSYDPASKGNCSPCKYFSGKLRRYLCYIEEA